MEISHEYKLLHNFYLRTGRGRTSVNTAIRALGTVISALEDFMIYPSFHNYYLERIVQRLRELRWETAYMYMPRRLF